MKDFGILDIMQVAHRTLIENMNDPVMVLDSQDYVVDLNLAAQRLTGHGASETIDQPIAKVLSKWPALVERYLNGREINEEVLLEKDGTKHYFDLRISPLHDQKGNFIGRLIIFHDITEHKRMEEALCLFEKTVETMQLGLTITDSEGKIIYTNPAEANMHGYRVEELIGKDVRTLAPREIWSPMTESQLLKMKSWKRESVNVRRDGSIFPVQLMSVVVTNLAGYPLGVVTTCEDTTERKRAEAEMATLEEQLRQSQKMEAIGRLAGGIAHDFNNLLTVITGYSDLLLRCLDQNSPVTQDAKEIKNAAEKAAELTRQLLAFSRRQILSPKILDLNTFISNIDKILRRLIGEDIELVTLLADDLEKVRIDPNQIEQVILNLAINARDAMPSGGKLMIETANVKVDEEYARTHIHMEPGRYVMLSVTDTGTGMPPEVKERIFEPFFTTKEVGKGTGLGLSMVYGIIQQSHGNVLIETEVGRGTTFRVYLPMVEATFESLQPGTAFPDIPQGSETILLVEDEVRVRTLMREILERNGYHVLEAGNGYEALNLLLEHTYEPIHLILTDIVMPVMNGHRLVERTIHLRPKMKVLYVSGYPDAILHHSNSPNLGMDFLQKPFTPNTLACKVREVLDSPQKDQHWSPNVSKMGSS